MFAASRLVLSGKAMLTMGFFLMFIMFISLALALLSFENTHEYHYYAMTSATIFFFFSTFTAGRILCCASKQKIEDEA
jgi:hypothetical protein